MVIGGPNWLWRVDERGAVAAAQALIARCEADGGTLIAVGSPRTEASVAGAVSHALAGTRHKFVAGNMPSYRCLLADADEIHVTADSVSMLSEAIFTGKPVGMIPVQKRPAGRFVYTLVKLGLIDAPKPDLVPVWQELTETGLVGTVDEPRAGETQNPVKLAMDAVARACSTALRASLPRSRAASPAGRARPASSAGFPCGRAARRWGRRTSRWPDRDGFP